MRKLLTSLFFIACALGVQAQVLLSDGGKGNFQLVKGNSCAAICYDGDDALVVGKAAGLLADDIELVSGKRPLVSTSLSGVRQQNVIIAGTMGQSSIIDELIGRKKITPQIEGKWESYSIELVKNPVKGIGNAIVITGSDRRGTAYGLLSVSRAIGVSPWVWWMDANPKKRSNIALNVQPFTSKEPSVKFRGIFINDEDWGLFPWAQKTYEPEMGNFGPRTYAKVCELLLRLNANHLAPAMHNCSLAFHKVPENRLVADSFAIVMGSSHCEPLLLNTATEWDGGKYGPWDYNKNKHGVDSVLNARAQELASFENVYTLALRGLHDVAMAGSDDMNERRATMERALAAQRQMIADATGKPAETIPQAFTPYKEVLDVYDHGLELPDDVTIIWPDDNYGYMKRLSSPKEQQRSGRSGVYYHSSYLGRPHDHLWMATNSPNHMYEELKKAYDLTADRVWLLNAGDIKGCEFTMDQFLAMAYDIDSFDYERCANYRQEWTRALLGDDYDPACDEMIREFYRLAFQRKPEAMGWGQEWSTDDRFMEQTTDTEFSFANYHEAENRIADYMRIGAKVEELLNKMPAEKRSCFYEAVYYPVKGCELMNRMHLTAQKNRWYAEQNRALTDQLAKEVDQCYDSLQIITAEYNSLENGKWNHMMSMAMGPTASYFEKPSLHKANLTEEASLGVCVEGEEYLNGPQGVKQLPVFSKYNPKKTYYIDIFNKGKQPLSWTIDNNDEWLKIDVREGTTLTQQRVNVSIDWSLVPEGNGVHTMILVSDGTVAESVYVSVFNPSSPSTEELQGLLVEDNGFISIPAADFARKHEPNDVKMTVIDNLGCEDKVVQMGDPTQPRQNIRNPKSPYLEYDFYTWQRGMVDVYTYVLPTFTTSIDRGYAGHEQTMIENQYGVRIDDGLQVYNATNSWEYAQMWYESVERNTRINKRTLYIDKPGKHTVRITCSDPGILLQKIVLDFGGLKKSYLKTD